MTEPAVISSKRSLVIALAISAALNLFALGFLAARAVRPHHDEQHHGPFMGPRGLMREGFGPKALPMVDDVLARHGSDLRRVRGELKRARHEVRDALLAEPFDRGRLERALADLRARTDGAQAQMHEALVDLASSLPLEQRKHLARRALAFEAMGLGGKARRP